MASITIRTKPITREKLAKFFPDNHELVRLLESLTQDVIVNIPGTVDPSVILLDEVQQTAEIAGAVANAARAMAVQALVLASQDTDGPPATPQVLADAPDDLFAQLSALRERISVAERVIAELKEGPSP